VPSAYGTMFSTALKRSLATLAVGAGLLAAAGPARAGASVSASAPTRGPGVIGYNGHAGLGAGITDGTSNTIMFGARAGAPRGFSVDTGTSENVASDGLGADYILMADMGGQL
jgi:hypothetical protein